MEKKKVFFFLILFASIDWIMDVNLFAPDPED